MTENEALKITKLFRDEWDRNSKTKNAEALDIAIQALSEIQQYRAIGTVEQLEWCKDASHWKELFKEKLEKYEAIGTVEELQKMKGVITDFPIDCGSPTSNVEEILNQLKKYLAIGTVKKFKALNEKNIAKKPISSPTSMYGWDCPNCKNIVYDEKDDIIPPKHCDTCGQKLDWE